MTVVDDGLGEIAKLTGNGLGGTQFDEVAIGSGSTVVTASDTALVSEITTNGGARDTDSSAASPLKTTTITDDTLSFRGEWTFTGSLTIWEFGVFNGAATDIMLLRQVFDSALNVVSGDTLTLDIDVVVTTTNDTDGTGSDQVITNDGIAYGNKLIVADSADPADGRFKAIGLGSDDGTALAAAATNTRLGAEYITSGLSRTAATVTQVTTNNTGANAGGDTTRFEATFNVTATQAINEVGVFSLSTAPTDDGTGSTDTTTDESGTMLMRHIFADPLNVVNTDTITFKVDCVNGV